MQPVSRRRPLSSLCEKTLPSRCKRIAAVLPAAALFVLLVGAQASFGHGPTIKLAEDEMKPVLLNLHVGATVHFSNMVPRPGGHVIIDEGGTLESPPLAEPGDGWHYTFGAPGTFEVFVKEQPKLRARIVVIPKPGPPGSSPGH